MDKEVKSVAKWEDLRKTIKFAKEEEKEMQQEMEIIQKIIETRTIK